MMGKTFATGSPGSIFILTWRDMPRYVRNGNTLWTECNTSNKHLSWLFQDSSVKILEILEGKPDLVIGNYTDGNLVASLMSSKLGVTQVNMSHQNRTLQKCSIMPPNKSDTTTWKKNRLINQQGTIAHALEKTKYEDSDVKWREMDQKYHFSCQFTADMIAMNTSDFVVASTYQEIAGRSDPLETKII